MMSRMAITTTAAFVLLLSYCVHAQDYAMEGSEFSLACVSNQAVASNPQVLYWLLHGSGNSYPIGYTDQAMSILPDGSLYIKQVKIDHEGDHLCVASHNGTIMGNPVSMKVRPLPPQDLWNDVYKSQFITGLVAAFICAFLFTAGCLVFKFRYRNPKHGVLIGDEGGHVNPTLDLEGDSNTKM